MTYVSYSAENRCLRLGVKRVWASFGATGASDNLDTIRTMSQGLPIKPDRFKIKSEQCPIQNFPTRILTDNG